MSKITNATEYVEERGASRPVVEAAVKKFFDGWTDQQELETFLKYSCGASEIRIRPNGLTGTPEAYAERWRGYDEDGNDVAEVICDVVF